MNQKGFIQLLLIILLLIGIGVGVYLTQFTQVFKPKASGTPEKVTTSNFEPTLNPFSDAWAWKKAQNPSLPIAAGGAGLGQYIRKSNGNYVYPDPNGVIKEALAQYYAKNNAGYVYLDSYEPDQEGVDPRSIEVITRAKQINPNIKFLGYYVQWEAPPGWGEIITKADAGEQYFEDFLVHRENTPSRKENRITARPDHPEWGLVPLLDITNPNVRSFVVPKLVAAIQAAKMDGVMNDGLFFNAASAYNPNSDFPNNYMPAATKQAWPGAMAQFVQDIKAGMAGTNLEIFGNVDDDNPQFMQNDLLRSGRLDGVIFEDPFNSRLDPSPAGITKVSGLMDLVDQVGGKKAIYIVSGAHNGTTFASSSQPAEIGVHRYFLAAFMLTMRNGNHMLEYHYPTSIFYQYNSQAFFKEWNLNLGAPTSGIEDAGSGVFLRKFQKGYVYWNPTFNNFTIPGGSGLYNIDNGQNIDGQVVPAKSGGFFVTQEVLNEYNNPPASTTSPSPSATLAPPPVSCALSGGVCVNNINKTADGKTCSQSLNLGPTGDCTGAYIYCFAANSCSTPTQPPPTSYSLNLSTFTGSSIPVGVPSFTWNRASGEHHVTIKVDDHANDFNNCAGPNRAGDTCEVNFTGSELAFNFLKDHNYTVQVFQHDVAGNQLGLISVNFVVLAPGPLTLNQPTTFCSGTNSHIKLSWTESANGPKPGLNSGYFVYVNGEYKYNALHALTLDDPEAKTPGQTYRYKIEAVNLPDGRTFSNEQTVTAAYCSLNAPNFTGNTLAYCNDQTSRIHLEWASVPGAGGYKIFRSTITPGSGVKLGETSGTAYNDDTVIPGTDYQYSIEAFNNNTSTPGNGINIKAVSCTNPTASPSPSPIPSPSPSSSTSKKGDLDKDGDVDEGDIKIFIEDLTTKNLRSDLNGDGKVNIYDFNVLVVNYGQ